MTQRQQYAVVPVPADDTMLVAARDWSVETIGHAVGNAAANGIYRAMTDAAPPPPDQVLTLQQRKEFTRRMTFISNADRDEQMGLVEEIERAVLQHLRKPRMANDTNTGAAAPQDALAMAERVLNAVIAGDDVFVDDAELALSLLRAALPAQAVAPDGWRELALQFDGHRMQALAHLGMLLAAPFDHASAAAAFLAAPPLSGERVLADRITALAAPVQDVAPNESDALRCAVGNCTFNGQVAQHSATCPHSKVAKDVAPSAQVDHTPPYDDCSFRLCDLPGQCRGEGKCHHPVAPQAGVHAPAAPQAVPDALTCCRCQGAGMTTERDGAGANDHPYRAVCTDCGGTGKQQSALTEGEILAHWQPLTKSGSTRVDLLRFARAVLAEHNGAAQPAAQPVDAQGDMFWDDDDPERSHDSIGEVLNYRWETGLLEVGDVVTVQAAISLPKLAVRVTALNDGDVEYEEVDRFSGTQEGAAS